MNNIYQAFTQLENDYPLPDRIDPVTYRPVFNGLDVSTGTYTAPPQVEHVQYFNSKYIEPYASQFFGSSVAAVEMFEDPSFIPIIDRRVDPNKIFNSDIQALKTLAADQIKIKKMFEKKLMESLTEKGKVGLTEDDINAMQAITSAGSAIASINTSQANIKKTIAELRIKQQAANKEANVQAAPGQGGGRSMDTNDIGLNMLDNIFNSAMANQPVVGNLDTPNAIIDYPAAEELSPSLVDAVLPDVGENISAEIQDGEVYVVVDHMDEHAEFKAFTSGDNNTLIPAPDYPLPDSSVKIARVDREAHLAYDQYNRRYPLREEIN